MKTAQKLAIVGDTLADIPDNCQPSALTAITLPHTDQPNLEHYEIVVAEMNAAVAETRDDCQSGEGTCVCTAEFGGIAAGHLGRTLERINSRFGTNLQRVPVGKPEPIKQVGSVYSAFAFFAVVKDESDGKIWGHCLAYKNGNVLDISSWAEWTKRNVCPSSIMIGNTALIVCSEES